MKIKNKGNTLDPLNGVIMNKVTASNKYILNFVNLTLNKRVFPNILKTSSVIPIPK